jgi:hypothetical protein
MIVSAKNPYQGYSVGLLLFDGIEYQTPPGDVGNATTYPFPVLLRVVERLFDNPFPPLALPDGTYTDDVRQATGLAVYDFVSCVEWMHRAVTSKQYSGYI